MKQLLTTIAALVLVGCGESKEKQIIGEWIGKNVDGEVYSLIFNSDGSASVVLGNAVIPDENLSWNLNTKHKPNHLDLIVVEDKKMTFQMRMIFRFISKNKIQLEFNKDDAASRPAKFSIQNKEAQLVLTKQPE